MGQGDHGACLLPRHDGRRGSRHRQGQRGNGPCRSPHWPRRGCQLPARDEIRRHDCLPQPTTLGWQPHRGRGPRYPARAAHGGLRRRRGRSGGRAELSGPQDPSPLAQPGRPQSEGFRMVSAELRRLVGRSARGDRRRTRGRQRGCFRAFGGARRPARGGRGCLPGCHERRLALRTVSR